MIYPPFAPASACMDSLLRKTIFLLIIYE
jgi:hypothetical protein